MRADHHRPNIPDSDFWDEDQPVVNITEVHSDARWVKTGLLHPNGRPLLKRVTPAIGFRADHAIVEYAPDYED